MKKIYAWLLLSVLVFSALSCGKTSPDNVTPDPPVVIPDPPTPTERVVDYNKYQLKEVAAKAGLKLGKGLRP